MKTATQNAKGQTAAATYKAAWKLAQKRLAQISQAVERDRKDFTGFDWSAVGSLNHVNELLADIQEFMLLEGETK